VILRDPAIGGFTLRSNKGSRLRLWLRPASKDSGVQVKYIIITGCYTAFHEDVPKYGIAVYVVVEKSFR
jgi:hypothetical protein